MSNPSGLVFAFGGAAPSSAQHHRKKPVQSRSQATVDAILKATLQVLDEVGLQKVTTTRVAARAGVSVGTLYQYFPDKAALIGALKAADRARILASLTEVARAQRGRPLEAAFRAIIAAILAIKYAKRSYVLALTEVDRAALALIVEVVAPLLPVEQAPMRAAVLVAALDGPIVHAATHRPSLLKSPAFADELCALAIGYVRRCQARDRAAAKAARPGTPTTSTSRKRR